MGRKIGEDIRGFAFPGRRLEIAGLILQTGKRRAETGRRGEKNPGRGFSRRGGAESRHRRDLLSALAERESAAPDFAAREWRKPPPARICFPRLPVSARRAGPRGTLPARDRPIMIRKDYVPQEESAQLTWAENLNTQSAVTANQTAMGWSAAEGTAVGAAASSITNAVMAKETARAAYLSTVADSDADIAAALGTIRPLVSAGKDQSLYTQAAGQLLGVVGAEIAFNPQTYKAELRDVTPVGNGTLRVKFAKALGELDAAHLFLRKGGQSAWTMAATMMRSPFLHQIALATPGVPEAFEARIRGIVRNDEIGEYSDIVLVAVT